VKTTTEDSANFAPIGMKAMQVTDYFDAFLVDAMVKPGENEWINENTYKILSHGLPLDPDHGIKVYKEFNIARDSVELTIFYRAMIESFWAEEDYSHMMRTDVELKKEDFDIAAGLSDNPEQMDAIIWSWVRRDMEYDIWDMKRQNKEQREHGTRFGNG